MITGRAIIKLYTDENKRKTPFTTDYRPLFQFVEEFKISGQITFPNQEKFISGIFNYSFVFQIFC
ncbi:hypothetical protein D3C72_1455420 [compost metagenome]